MDVDEDKREKQHKLWSYAAAVLGFNELAKMAETFGEKVYFRLRRDAAELEYLDCGGKRFLVADETLLEIPAGHRLWIRFTKDDIEMMRTTVAEYDAKAAEGT
jgi:hypothetical protein